MAFCTPGTVDEERRDEAGPQSRDGLALERRHDEEGDKRERHRADKGSNSSSSSRPSGAPKPAQAPRPKRRPQNALEITDGTPNGGIGSSGQAGRSGGMRFT